MRGVLLPGAYLAKRRTAAGLSTADVAARVACEPKISELGRKEWVEAIEAGLHSPTIHELTALRRAYPFSVDVLARLAAIADGEQLPPPRLCRDCGCSEHDCCTVADKAGTWTCSWANEDPALRTDDPDLCNFCAPAAFSGYADTLTDAQPAINPAGGATA